MFGKIFNRLCQSQSFELRKEWLKIQEELEEYKYKFEDYLPERLLMLEEYTYDLNKTMKFLVDKEKYAKMHGYKELKEQIQGLQDDVVQLIKDIDKLKS